MCLQEGIFARVRAEAKPQRRRVGGSGGKRLNAQLHPTRERSPWGPKTTERTTEAEQERSVEERRGRRGMALLGARLRSALENAPPAAHPASSALAGTRNPGRSRAKNERSERLPWGETCEIQRTWTAKDS